MTDIQTRPFSKNYSGLVNQTVIACGIAVICVTSQELMKRRRRGDSAKKAALKDSKELGSRETWEFGYLYQGRSWAQNPSPPSPRGWPLSWVKQAINFSELEMRKLRGIDAALYVRLVRGTFYWVLLQSCTAFPILFAIHVHFSSPDIPSKSMTRASISSLVLTNQGKDLLWIHMCFMFWITLTWTCNLLWICHGAFHMRAAQIEDISQRVANSSPDTLHSTSQPYAHPHPQYAFRDITTYDPSKHPAGYKARTIMVTNLPPGLRKESELKDYFSYFLGKQKLDKPAVGITSSTTPGFFNKSFAFLFNRAKRLPSHLPTSIVSGGDQAPEVKALEDAEATRPDNQGSSSKGAPPMVEIERVVIVRKMTELASLLERREDILRRLETAHIKLAKKTLTAVCNAMQRQRDRQPLFHKSFTAQTIAKVRARLAEDDTDLEHCAIPDPDDEAAGEQCMRELIQHLSPYVEEFRLSPTQSLSSRIAESKKNVFRRLRKQGSDPSVDGDHAPESQSHPPSQSDDQRRSIEGKTIWEALLTIPRDSLDAYQPLINLSTFRNKLVPAIDYYTIKLNIMYSLIMEQRAKPAVDHKPASTAFVTFADPHDARRACQYMAVHPDNPLACIVTMAPAYDELDWPRLMKLSFSTEFVKDWVVNAGVWGFTIFWLFPVSLLVGLVSIQNISTFWPALAAYLAQHAWEEELIQSFLPTLLVSLLAILIPLILLLIAKKANTFTTLSALHDRIMSRYYKFLVVNVLVFFCVGVAALQSLLSSIKDTTAESLLNIVATSFPTAGPFYVGWIIFTTAMHGGLELALHWLPNHLLLTHILLVFTVLNPLVLPVGALYFFIESGVIKNQLLHVYAKNYEQNGHHILIRLVRYSLDGAILSQVVFMAYMVVLEKTVNVGLTAFLIVLTAVIKLILTRICRYQFELDDIKESDILCGMPMHDANPNSAEGEVISVEGRSNSAENHASNSLIVKSRNRLSAWTNAFPAWASLSNISYATLRRHPHRPDKRQPNPFRELNELGGQFQRLSSISADRNQLVEGSSKQPECHKSGADDKYPHHRPQFNRKLTSDHSKISSVLLNPQILIEQALSPTDDDPSTKITSHPPPIPWNDNTMLELPYDNPYYTRTITNALWLPRNPFGILDLDDTIDLDQAITTRSSSGINRWLGNSVVAIVKTPEEEISVAMERSLSHVTQNSWMPYTGDEDIELPPVIRQRVESREKDIEPRAPWATRRGSSASRGTIRRPSTLAPRMSFRSFSAPGEPSRDRTLSLASALTGISLDRARSADHELGLRTNSGHLVPPSSDAASSLHPPPLNRAQNISAHEAIVHEVLIEHEQVKAEEKEEELKEEEKEQAQKSWFVSWLYKKRPTHV